MELSELTIKLLLLFFPGIICFLIVERLTVHVERKLYQIILHAYLYGVASYLTFTILSALLHISVTKEHGIQIPFPDVHFLKTLTTKDVEVDCVEVGEVTLLSVVLGFVFSYILNHYWLHKIATKFGCTRNFGAHNVWLHSLELNEVTWATVRDTEKNQMYQGYIRAFSDYEDPLEILLTTVSVYNEQTGEHLYDAEVMYLARKKDNITIEFPPVND